MVRYAISCGMSLLILSGLLFGPPGELSAVAQERKTRDELVREDLSEVVSDAYWIYNDLEKGIQEAKQTGKPLLVVIRCIPCEACAQLDAQVVERDRVARELMDQYVCVRIVQANGLDLAKFQYDYDQSFAAFLLNADLTIYGRYGTRSHQTESSDDVSIRGFAEALRRGLALHKNYPQNLAQLAGKQPTDQPAFAVPELYPSLRERYGRSLDYDGEVARSCIHCHQVGEVQREIYWRSGKAIPDKLLFPYPHPKVLGLIMDPDHAAQVRQVTPNSVAYRAGFQPGDRLTHLNGQALLSMADIQWVLHQADESPTLTFDVERDGNSHQIIVKLPKGWREWDTLDWRVGSWSLARMTLGGLRLENVDAETLTELGLSDESLALRVKYVGQYNEHALAKNSGFRKDDIIVRVDDQDQSMRESDLFAYLVRHKKIGDQVPFVVLRDGERSELTLRMQP